VTAPAGFEPLPVRAGLTDALGPIYMRIRDGKLGLGFRVAAKHCNPIGICHGGMLMTLADIQCGFGARVQADLNTFLPTISFSCDFLKPAAKGDWVEGETEVIKTTRNLAFLQCVLRVEGEIIVRASGIMKIPSGDHPDLRNPPPG